MPICSNPNDAIDFHLQTDASKPAESRPTFELRFLTANQHKKVTDLLKRASESADDEASSALRDEAINVGLAGWRNMPALYPTPFIDFLTQSETWELAHGVLNQPFIEEQSRRAAARAKDVAVPEATK